MIEIKNITIQYKQVLIDKGECIFKKGYVHLINGPSGSGKSTLLYRLARINKDKNYEYRIDGIDILKLSEGQINQLRRTQLSYVLQNNLLLNHFDVENNLRHFASLVGKILTIEEIYQYLDMVHLDVPLNQDITTLSGGERQRLSIACGLVKETPILILDEPTSALDKNNELEIFKILKELAYKYHKCVIMASHSPYAKDYSDVIYQIKDKKIIVVKDVDDNQEIGVKPRKIEFHFHFIRNYLYFFFKKYKLMQFVTILVMFLSMVSYVGSQIYFEVEKNKSLSSLERISDRQLLITNKEGDGIVPMNEADYQKIKQINNIKVYPYLKVYTNINGFDIDVIPYYEENNIKDKVESGYRERGIFISRELYYNLKTNVQLDNINYHVISFDDKKIKEENINLTLKMNGIMKRNVKTYYSANQNYMYVPEDVYNEFIKKSNQYYGYTIFCNTFDELNKVSEVLENNGYIVNDDFQDVDTLNRIVQDFDKIIQSMNLSVIIITVILLTILMAFYLRQQRIEIALLKLNGVRYLELLTLFVIDFLMKVITVFLLFVIISFIFQIDIIYGLKILFIEYGIILCIIIYLHIIIVKRLVIEDILRN